MTRLTDQLSLNLSQQVLLMVPLPCLRWSSIGKGGGRGEKLPCFSSEELPCPSREELPCLSREELPCLSWEELPCLCREELPCPLLPSWGVRRRKRLGEAQGGGMNLGERNGEVFKEEEGKKKIK